MTGERERSRLSFADPKPHRRIRDPGLLKRLKLRWRECALCGRTSDLHLHHIVYRGHSGDDLEANLVCLCESCHRAIHAGETAPLVAYIRAQRPDTAAYLRAKGGSRLATLL